MKNLHNSPGKKEISGVSVGSADRKEVADLRYIAGME